MNIKQFDIVMVNLNPTKGSEQSWVRPCIILQSNTVSDYWKTTIIAVLTSKKIDKIYPFEVFIEKWIQNWLSLDSKIKLDQIKVIDKTRVINKIWDISNNEIIKQIYSSLDNILDRQWYFR